MLKPISASDSLLYSTIRIQTDCGVGTGFFIQFPCVDDKTVPAIITNKHVIEGAKSGELYFHLADDFRNGPPLGKFYKLEVADFTKGWVYHPDANIDLCAVPLNPILEKAKAECTKDIFYRSIDPKIILPDKDLENLRAMEDVVMIGYPNGLWDDINNFPIIRKGITASHPAINFKGRSEGVVDIACFHGSSGSPVFVLNEGTYADKNTNTVSAGTRLILLGVLYAGPYVTADGTIEIQEIPTKSVPISKTNVMMHLGYYVKAKEILTLGRELLLKYKVDPA